MIKVKDAQFSLAGDIAFGDATYNIDALHEKEKICHACMQELTCMSAHVTPTRMTSVPPRMESRGNIRVPEIPSVESLILH